MVLKAIKNSLENLSEKTFLSKKIFYEKNKCHDLEEILWVPNFLLYLSNMLSTIGVKELRFYT